MLQGYDNHLVSVIIPTYRSDETLLRAINSALGQTYPYIEIIVVDDNDPDSEFRKNTEKLMLEYSKESRVKYIKHPQNRNGSAARNTGFRNSLGKYICLLDDDDYFLPEKIEKQVQYLTNHMEFGGCYTWRKEKYMGQEIVVESQLKGDLSKEILTLEFTPYTSSLMLRRESYDELNGFDESFVRHQDFEFMLRFFEKYAIGVVEVPLVVRDDNGVDNQPHGKKLDQVKKKFFEQFGEKIDVLNRITPGIKKVIYSRHYVDVTKQHFKDGDIMLGFKSSLRMMTSYPWTFLRFFCGDIFRAAKRRLQRINGDRYNGKV